MKEKEEDAKSRSVLRNQRIFATETTAHPYLIIEIIFEKRKKKKQENNC